MASVNRYTARHYDWDGGLEATTAKAEAFCSSINSSGGWVSASAVEGYKGNPPVKYAYPVITVGGEYSIEIIGSGHSEIYKNGVWQYQLASMNGDQHEIVTVYDNSFVLFLIHGCHDNRKTNASIAICCMNIDGKRISGYSTRDHYQNSFNSLNDIPLYDESREKYVLTKIFKYDIDEHVIDTDFQPLSYIKDSGFVACPNLPLNDAFDHKIIKFQNSEYYAAGTNTLIRIER